MSDHRNERSDIEGAGVGGSSGLSTTVSDGRESPHAVIRLLLWYIFAEPEDTFLDRLRKTAVGMLLPCIACPLAYIVWMVYLITTDAQEEKLGLYLFLTDCVLFIPVFVTSYFVSRRARRVSQTTMDVTVLVMTLQWTVMFSCYPNYGNQPTLIALSLLAVVAQSNYVGLCFGLTSIMFALDNFNNSFFREGKAFFLVPGFRFGTSLEQFLGGCAAQFCFLMMAVAAWVQSLALKKQIREANTSVALSQRVVNLLRKYDVNGVVDALKSEDFEMADPALKVSLAAMNANLEKYKPYLPSFLFQSTSSDDDDESDLEAESVSSAVVDRSSSSARSSNTSRTSESTSSALHSQPVQLASQSEVDSVPTLSLLSKDSIFEGTITVALLERPSTAFGVASVKPFVEAVHQAAKATRGSLHSMVGDAVCLSWNATTRVLQPEVKGVKFLEQVRETLGETKAAAGVVFTGRGSCISTTSSLQQHAHVLVANWLAAAHTSFWLARRCRTQLMCSRTRDAVQDFMMSTPVDVVKYSSTHQEHNSTLCDILLRGESINSTLYDRERNLFEISGRVKGVLPDQSEDEWMYFLDRQRASSVSATDEAIASAFGAFVSEDYSMTIATLDATLPDHTPEHSLLRRLSSAAEAALRVKIR